MSRTRRIAQGALAAAFMGACSAAFEAAPTGSTTSSGGGGGGGSAGAGGEGGSGETLSASSVGGASGVGGGCTGTSSKARPSPLDIFVMLDQSSSMSEDAGNGQSRWDTVTGALTSFVFAEDAQGIGIGLQYFGIPAPGIPGCYQLSCTNDDDCAGCGQCLVASGVCQAPWNPDVDSCDASDYAWAEVPIQPLPDGASAILASLAWHQPSTNTPTEPALAGAILYAKAWAIAHPDRPTVVAFATDGGPGECNTDLGYIGSIAADGLAGEPSIRTFVIGVGPLLDALDGIAASGGTGAAFHVDLEPTAEQQFLDAMNAIRAAALPCVYQIPDPPEGEALDYGLVNVTYAPGDGAPEQTIPRVAGAASCPPGGDGWYYDDPSIPAEIVLCEGTCDAVAADAGAVVSVVLGCETVVP
jgi:hypothetical protein